MTNLLSSETATHHSSTSPQYERKEWDPLNSVRELPNVLFLYGDPAQMLLRTTPLAKDNIPGTPWPGFALSRFRASSRALRCAPVQRPSFVAQQEWEGCVWQEEFRRISLRLA